MPSESEGVSLLSQFLRARRFLTDANLTDVYRTLETSLPPSVLLVKPSQSHMVAMGASEDSHLHVAEIAFEQRDVILVPVNDASLRKGSEGKHWSLLALLRSSEGQNSACFSAVLYDSARLSSHEAGGHLFW